MLIASIIDLIRRYSRYRSQLESISQLDERTLRDIGISRGELATAARNLSRAAIPLSVRSARSRPIKRRPASPRAFAF